MLLIQIPDATRPDVAVVDIEMPELDGISAAAALRQRSPACRVLILTMHGRPGFVQRALESGVAGFVLKDAPVETLFFHVGTRRSGFVLRPDEFDRAFWLAGEQLTMHLGACAVTIMGGAVRVPGNLGFGGPADNDVAEWNIYVDPTAAQTVIDSGVAVRLVSLDGTNNVPVTPAFAKRVRDEATGAGGQVLAELFAANPWMAEGGYYLWDPLAAAIAAGHPLGSFEPARIDIEEAEGPEVGFTRPVEGTPNVEYLSGVEKAAAEDILVGALD